MWKRQEFYRLKTELLADIEAQYPVQDTTGRLQHALDRIGQLKDDPNASMTTFILVMYTLNQHLKFGGLRDPQIRDLLELGEAILTLAGIKPRSSSLASLYGELHLVSSQLHILRGEALPAAWEQQIAIHLSGREPPGGMDFQGLNSAIQALRLGLTGLAVDELWQIYEHSPEPTRRGKAAIHLLRAFRLSGQLDHADELATKLNLPELTEKARLELTWEAHCRQIKRGESIKPLLSLTRSRKPHHRPGYLLEAFFWSRSLTSQETFSALPKLKTLRQRKDLTFQYYPIFYRCAHSLEQAYDTDIPFHHRLSHAKRLMTSLYELQSIDQQLLIMAALIRWLIRSNHRRLSRLLFAEYTAISRKLSDGREADSLGILQDLQHKSWLTAGQHIPSKEVSHD